MQMVVSLLIWGGLILLTLWLPLSSQLRWALWVIGASLPCYAITSVCETLFQAAERMELVLGVEMSINTLILVLSLLVLWQGGGVVRLAAVVVITQLISAGLAWWLLMRYQLLSPPVTGQGEHLTLTWPALARQALPFYGLALADVLLQRLDILLLSAVGSATVIGIYSAAYNLVRVVLKLIQSFWKALYPTLSRLRSQSTAHYTRLGSMSLHYGLVLLLPVAVIGFGLAADLLHLIYSGAYKGATPVLQLLLCSALFFWVESYGITLLTVEHRPQQSLLITCVHLLVMALLLPWLTATSGATGAAWAVTLAGLAGMLVGGWGLRRLALPVLPNQVGGLLCGLAAGGLCSVYLPVTWPLRLASSVLIYLLLAWYTGVIAPADQQTLWRALGRP
jgi:O-antigen/teichoic acid export membrane protein